MTDVYVEWSALGNILLFGLLLGAGLPALYALGVRAMQGDGALKEDGTVRPSRMALAFVCFGVCVFAVIGGVAFIALGG